MSDDAFTQYTSAVERMKATEKSANDTVRQLGQLLFPVIKGPNLLPSQVTQYEWKSIYLSGLGNEVPAVMLATGGPGNRAMRRQINLGGLHATLVQLQTFMVQYAEAEEAAHQAYQQIPSQQRGYVAPPPWMPQPR
jgi:hypothetical protein